VGLCLVVAVVAGCGGDDAGAGKATAPAPSSPRTETQTERNQAASGPGDTTETGQSPEKQSGSGQSPEKQPGGAGDEEPARSQALFSGRAGRVRPAVVRVPSFVAIRIELRSADGAPYALRFGNRTLRAGRTASSVSASFNGLRPGKALVGEPVGGGNRVRVEATAEPGP
jgi:hypothetical protein